MANDDKQSGPIPEKLAQLPGWEQRYQEIPVESMPWFYPDLDPDLAQALDRLDLRGGRALDLGTGPGTQAIALARRGFAVTASDLSPTAVAKAAARAQAEGVTVHFQQDDILASRLAPAFDLIFDRGCFHVIDPARRPDYAAVVHRLLAPGGTLFLKCFSVKQPGTEGPHRFAPADIRQVFGGPFAVESIAETVYQGTLSPQPLALFCVLRRQG